MFDNQEDSFGFNGNINLGNTNEDDSFFDLGNEDETDSNDFIENIGTQEQASGNDLVGNYTPDINNMATGNQDDEVDEAKKRTKLLMIIGGAVIIVTIALGGLVSLRGSIPKNNKVTVEKQQVTIDSNRNVNNIANAAANNVSNVRNKSGWLEIEADNSLNFSEEIEGDFTVTGIRHYVKDTTLKEKEIKTVLTGSIGGLTGTYELEVPYSQGCNLNIGNSFSITYSIALKNDYQIIGNISY